MSRETLISEMSHVLRGPGVNLGGERGVIRALQNVRYLVLRAYSGRAIEFNTARSM